MTRRRYVQVNGELIEVSPDYAPEPRRTDAVLWNDRAYQDMNDARFRSRTQHREYMKQHNLTTVDDFAQHDQREAKRREDFYRGIDHERRADIARAMERARG